MTSIHILRVFTDTQGKFGDTAGRKLSTGETTMHKQLASAEAIDDFKL